MSKSYSKIRHINESNQKLESRVLNENIFSKKRKSEEQEKIEELKHSVMTAFGPVASPNFKDDTYETSEPSLKEIIRKLKLRISDFEQNN